MEHRRRMDRPVGELQEVAIGTKGHTLLEPSIWEASLGIYAA